MNKKTRHAPSKRRSPKKDVPLNIRVSGPEKEAFDRAAEIAGVALSAWIRERLRTAAMLELDNVREVAPFFLGPRGNQDATA